MIEKDYYDSFYEDLENFEVGEEALDEMHGLNCTGVDRIVKQMSREKRLRYRSMDRTGCNFRYV